MKKLFLYLLCLFILPFPASSAFAGDETNPGDFTINLYNGRYMIQKYLGDAENVIIPAEISKHEIKGIESTAFLFNTNLKSVTIPNSITSILNSPFTGCKNLEEFIVSPEHQVYETIDGVLFNKRTKTLDFFPKGKKITEYTVPEGITSIRNFAFSGNDNLISLTLPDSLMTVGLGFVTDCDKLEEIRISSNNPIFETIDGVLFNKETKTLVAFPPGKNVTEYTVPQGIISIGERAFYKCENLTSITLPEGLTSIEEAAFEGCRNLLSITLPEGLTTIEEGAFATCYKLKSVTLPESLTSIGDRAFFNCQKLNSINFPEGLISIGDSAFGKCKSLKSVTLPEGLTSFGKDAFKDCDNLDISYQEAFESERITSGDYMITTLENGTAEIAHYDGNAEDLIIPSEISGYPITKIGNYAFAGNTSLTSITLPDGLTSIGEAAFITCTNLASVSLPNSLTSIGDQAFSMCRNLSSIIFPEGLTSIGSEAFSECENLKTITLPKGLTAIEDGAFLFCSRLVSVTLPENLSKIGNNAFSGCSGLTSITFPEGLTEIGDNAFSNCSGLTSIAFPEGLTEIGNQAFYWCRNLTSVTLPETLTSIGDGAFSLCENLETITLPKGLTAIGERAFQRCSSLTSINLPASLTSIGEGIFYESKNLQEINISPENDIFTIIDDALINKKTNTLLAYLDKSNAVEYTVPQGITSIGDGAFYWCENLTTVVLPESITTIGNGAFSNCENLSSINFPESLTAIGMYAFSSCYKLTSVTLPAGLTSIGKGAFEDSTELIYTGKPEYHSPFTEIMPTLENILSFPLETPAEDILASIDTHGIIYTKLEGYNEDYLYCEDDRPEEGVIDVIIFVIKDDGTGTVRLASIEGYRIYQYEPEDMEADFNKYLEESGIQDFPEFYTDETLDLELECDGSLFTVNEDISYAAYYMNILDDTSPYPAFAVIVQPIYTWGYY